MISQVVSNKYIRTYVAILFGLSFLVFLQLLSTPISTSIQPLFLTNFSRSPDEAQIYYNSSHTSFLSKDDQGSDVRAQPYYLKKNQSLLKYCSISPKSKSKLILVKEAALDFKALLDELQNSGLKEDGSYTPPECISKNKIAIVVPYRDRFEHLNIFLRNMHPFLQRQRIAYTIFVVEQAGYQAVLLRFCTTNLIRTFVTVGNGLFNRGMLMNIGFVEALKHRDYDCFIFHDVDLLPEDNRNLYSCPEQPRHMSVAVDVFRYKLPYTDIFGGVCAMASRHFKLVNGFSNMFWGWGGEDDDMAMRIKMKGLHVARYPATIARYTMLSHNKRKANPTRNEQLHHGRKRFKIEGLNSLEYQRLSIRLCKLFTWIFVELNIPTKENAVVQAIKNLQLFKFQNP